MEQKMKRALMVFMATALVSSARPVAAAVDCASVGEAVNNICGYVTLDGTTPVEGATVTVTGDGEVAVVTDSTGFYAVSVGGGTWDVTVDLSTSTTTIPEGSTVEPSQTISVSAPDNTEPESFTSFNVVSPDEVVEGTIPSPCDFTTSGGFVINSAGKKVSFGAHGGCKNGEWWGQINVVDHATGYHINSEEITGYFVPAGAPNPEHTRDICGLAWTNNPNDPQYVPFRVRLIDNGEPGSYDKFGIVLGNTADPTTQYHVSARLLSAQKPGGGNVQLHKENPSTTASSSLTINCHGLTMDEQ